MKTLQEVERELGFETRPVRRESAGCGYNPEGDDPAHDCNVIPAWHVSVRSEDEGQISGMLACDVHVSRLLAGPYHDIVLDFHEFGSACGAKDSWWINLHEAGSICMTTERGLELGYLKYDD